MAPMIYQHEDIGTAVLNSKIFVCGSSRFNPMVVEVYDPSLNQWSLIPPMNRIRQSAKLTANDGRLFAIDIRQNIIEMYHQFLNRWSFLPPIPNHKPILGVGIIPFSSQLLENIKNRP